MHYPFETPAAQLNNEYKLPTEIFVFFFVSELKHPDMGFTMKHDTPFET